MRSPLAATPEDVSPWAASTTASNNRTGPRPLRDSLSTTGDPRHSRSLLAPPHHPIREGRIFDPNQKRKLRPAQPALLKLIEQGFASLCRHAHSPTNVLLQNLCFPNRRCHRALCSDIYDAI
jgi:hypothetical protein